MSWGETVLCVVDALAPAAALDDKLPWSRVRAVEVVPLRKPDLADVFGRARVRKAVMKAVRPGVLMVEALHGELCRRGVRFGWSADGLLSGARTGTQTFSPWPS